MMIVLLVAIVWTLTAGLALTLFSADRRAEAMLVEARVPERPPRRLTHRVA